MQSGTLRKTSGFTVLIYSLVTSFVDTSTTPEQVAPIHETNEKGNAAQAEETPPKEEKPTAVVEPPSKPQPSPPEKSRSKKDRRKRKRPPKISLKDEKTVIRAAGDESYDSSELSEIEFLKSREKERRKEKMKEQDNSSADKAAFPVSTEHCMISFFCASFAACLKVAGDRIFISMHLCKEYARSASTHADNMKVP